MALDHAPAMTHEEETSMHLPIVVGGVKVFIYYIMNLTKSWFPLIFQ